MRALPEHEIQSIKTVVKLLGQEEELLERAFLEGKATQAEIDRLREAKYQVNDLVHERPLWLKAFERELPTDEVQS